MNLAALLAFWYQKPPTSAALPVDISYSRGPNANALAVMRASVQGELGHRPCRRRQGSPRCDRAPHPPRNPIPTAGIPARWRCRWPLTDLRGCSFVLAGGGGGGDTRFTPLPRARENAAAERPLAAPAAPAAVPAAPAAFVGERSLQAGRRECESTARLCSCARACDRSVHRSAQATVHRLQSMVDHTGATDI